MDNKITKKDLLRQLERLKKINSFSYGNETWYIKMIKVEN